MQTAGTDLDYGLYNVAFSDDLRPLPGQLRLSCRLPAVRRGDVLKVSLVESRVWLNDQPVEAAAHDHAPARKFIGELQLTCGQQRRTRRCSH
jgi:hypothetical protein